MLSTVTFDLLNILEKFPTLFLLVYRKYNAQANLLTFENCIYVPSFNLNKDKYKKNMYLFFF